MLFDQIVIYIIIACALAGCLASVIKENSGLGYEFLYGIEIGPIVLPVAGIMASSRSWIFPFGLSLSFAS